MVTFLIYYWECYDIVYVTTRNINVYRRLRNETKPFLDSIEAQLTEPQKANFKTLYLF